MGRPKLPGRGTPTYSSWVSMKERCSNPKATRFEHYGGRGIRVADRWQSFDNFLADMGERPPGTTLDRIDNNGNYEPGNCRWATLKEQQRNRNVSILITYKGETKTLHEWSQIVGLTWQCLKGRYERGWPHSDIIETPAIPPKLRRSRA